MLVGQVFAGRRQRGQYPSIASFGARAEFVWRRGALLAEREGPCLCSRQLWDVTLSTCAQCLAHPGEVLRDVRMHVRTTVLGFHLQTWKKAWAAGGAASTWADGCEGSSGFSIDLPRGFRCVS